LAHRPAGHIRKALTSLISPQLIRRRAERLGVVKRQRKIDPVALVYTLVLAFDRGAVRSMASLRRAYIAATGTSVVPSTFYDRFTPLLAELMRQLVAVAFERLARTGTKLHGTLAHFAKVFIADGSLVRLDDALKAHYPSVWSNHTKASAKLHLTIDAASRTPSIIQIVPGSQHDVSVLQPGPWCASALIVFDLAYYDGKLFQRILDHGGHFLCRVKKDANFLIRQSGRWDGRRHPALVAASKGRTFDVQIEHVYRNVPERDWTMRRLPLRLVGIWQPDAKRHRLYITSAPAELLRAHTVPAVYALRWEIELLFREIKQQLRIEDMPSGNLAAMQCLLYAALLSLAFCRRLSVQLATRSAPMRRPPTERFSCIIRTLAPVLLELLLGPRRFRPHLERALTITLRREAPDPNRKRLLLRERSAAGVMARPAAR
jgi:IS4 transposase